MTPERQQIVIAESLGLRVEYRMTNPPVSFSVARQCNDGIQYAPIPDYLNSRDAMAEALAGLTELEQGLFVEKLYKLVHGYNYYDGAAIAFLLIAATPSQLAEAYLRTKGLWEEEK